MARARTLTVLTLLAAMLACSAVAYADKKPTHRKVYLNGIDLDGVELPEAVFDSCSVRLDAKGNIYITAPGFEIAAKPAKTKQAPARPGALTQHYFLVTSESPRGATGYHVGVYVNGEKVTTVRSNAEPIVVDITRWVRAGANEIRMLASKSSARSGSPKQVLQIQLAEGDARNGEAIVRKTLLTYQRTAAEKTSFQHRYDFTAR
jgi:hypothetical protein